MTFNYRTVVNGRGYRFTLPCLGLPDPAGELVTIQVATSRKDPELLSTPSKPLDHPKSSISLTFGHHSTREIKHDGALWVLPILDVESDKDPHVFSVKVLRTPFTAPATRGDQQADRKDIVAAQPRSLLPGLSSASSTSTYSPSSSRPSTSSSSSSTTFGLHASPQTHICAHQGRSLIPVSLPGAELGLCVDCVKVKGVPRGNYLLEPDLHFEINEAFDHRLCWTKYVDSLPSGDPIPARLTDYEHAYHLQATPWAADVAQRTFFQLAQTSPTERCMLWKNLTTSNVGHPCTIVNNNQVFVNFALARDYQFQLKGVAGFVFIDGPALLKVVPKPSDYSCQPSAASSEASYFLNRSQLLIEQNGSSHLAIEPVARYIDSEEDSVLSILGQFASMMMQPSGKKLLFSSVPGPLPGLDDIYNVGIRLRDGGARFPISSSSSMGNKLYRDFQPPGDMLCHATFGEYGFGKELDEVEGKKTKQATIYGELPNGEALDLLLRVVEHKSGVYDELEYALRAQGNTEPVDEAEWQMLDPPIVDEWVVRYFLNLARLSYGRLARLL